MRQTPLSIRKIDLSAFHGARLAFAILQRGHGIPHQYSTYPCSYISVRIDTSHITTRSPAQPYDWPRLG